MTITQMNVTELYFPVALCIMLYEMAPAFDSVGKTIYRVSQKFVPLLHKSLFQYDWTW